MDLFQSTEGERLQIADADVVLWRHIALGDEHTVLSELIESTPWRQDHISVWGKTHPQPRLVAWYGDDALSYSYSGITLHATGWTPLLLQLRSSVQAVSGHTFNSVLLNYYRDQRDCMGFHADDEPELGREPVIASLSLGAERQLVFKHKFRSDQRNISLRLPSCSMLLMKGATQKYWKHGAPRQSRSCGPRVNLTFRTIVQR
jgi:alkylated DNA repair dioxygenase AlkB